MVDLKSEVLKVKLTNNNLLLILSRRAMLKLNIKILSVISSMHRLMLVLQMFDPVLHPSGTYNNQYMVLDRSKVKLRHSVDDGALTVVEQIPGLVEYSDQTQTLRRGNSSLFFSAVFLLFARICFSHCFCVPQVTGHPTTFPSTRRSTCWVVMSKCGRSMEMTSHTISVPEPRSSVVTRLMSRTWTLWNISWGSTVCGSVSVC